MDRNREKSKSDREQRWIENNRIARAIEKSSSFGAVDEDRRTGFETLNYFLLGKNTRGFDQAGNQWQHFY